MAMGVSSGTNGDKNTEVFFFSELHLQHMEVPRLGLKLEL